MKYSPYMLQHTEKPSKIHLYEIMKYEIMKWMRAEPKIMHRKNNIHRKMAVTVKIVGEA